MEGEGGETAGGENETAGGENETEGDEAATTGRGTGIILTREDGTPESFPCYDTAAPANFAKTHSPT